MSKRFTHKDLKRLFHNVAVVMGWNTVWWNDEGKVNTGAVRLDYYFYAGGWQIVRASSPDGGETTMFLPERLNTSTMRRVLEAMAWSRGYTEMELSQKLRDLPDHVLGTAEYHRGARIKYQQTMK